VSTGSEANTNTGTGLPTPGPSNLVRRIRLLPPGRNERRHVSRLKAERVRDPDVRQLAALAQLVNLPRADPELGGHLLDVQQVVGAARERAEDRGTG